MHRSVLVHGAAGQKKCCLGRGETTRSRAKVVFSRVCFPSFSIVAPHGQMDSFTLSVDRLRRSLGFCLDIYQTSRACVTKLSMVVHHNQLDCRVKRSICCHREGLCNQLMAVSPPYFLEWITGWSECSRLFPYSKICILIFYATLSKVGGGGGGGGGGVYWNHHVCQSEAENRMSHPFNFWQILSLARLFFHWWVIPPPPPGTYYPTE